MQSFYKWKWYISPLQELLFAIRIWCISLCKGTHWISFLPTLLFIFSSVHRLSCPLIYMSIWQAWTNSVPLNFLFSLSERLGCSHQFPCARILLIVHISSKNLSTWSYLLSIIFKIDHPAYYLKLLIVLEITCYWFCLFSLAYIYNKCWDFICIIHYYIPEHNTHLLYLLSKCWMSCPVQFSYS